MAETHHYIVRMNATGLHSSESLTMSELVNVSSLPYCKTFSNATNCSDLTVQIFEVVPPDCTPCMNEEAFSQPDFEPEKPL